MSLVPVYTSRGGTIQQQSIIYLFQSISAEEEPYDSLAYYISLSLYQQEPGGTIQLSIVYLVVYSKVAEWLH